MPKNEEHIIIMKREQINVNDNFLMLHIIIESDNIHIFEPNPVCTMNINDMATKLRIKHANALEDLIALADCKMVLFLQNPITKEKTLAMFDKPYKNVIHILPHLEPLQPFMPTH